MPSQSLYDILGILETASPEEIKAAHRRKIRTMHPDTGGSEEAAKQVNAAYEVLSDPVQRAAYDRSRRAHALVCPLCDEAVPSDDDLMAHIIRHRAEVAAAQHVVREAAQRAEAERVSRAPQDHEPAPTADPGRQPEPSSDSDESTSGGVGASDMERGTGSSANPPDGTASEATRRVSNLAIIGYSMLAVGAVIAVAAAFWTSRSQSDLNAGAVSGSVTTEAEAPTTSATGAPGTTSTTSTTTTEPATAPPAGASWALPAYDGSVLLNGSVSPAPPNSSVEYEFLNEDSDLYFVVDGTPTYNVVDGLCLDTDCDTSLRYMIDGPEFVWVTDSTDLDGPPDLSDRLHIGVQRDGEFLSACWSESFAGPVVAIVDAESATPTLDRAWVFVGESSDGSWFGLEPSMIDPESVLVPPFSFYDWQIAACGVIGGTAATNGPLVQPPASVPLFGEDATWGEELGMVSNALVGASIAWEDLRLVVDGELTDLSVISGWCVAPCEDTLTYAVPNRDFQRYVWFMMSSQTGASPALGLELTTDESVSHGCWSTSYDAPIVYTADAYADNRSAIRAWVFTEGDGGLTWYVADPTAVDPPESVVYDGELAHC